MRTLVLIKIFVLTSVFVNGQIKIDSTKMSEFKNRTLKLDTKEIELISKLNLSSEIFTRLFDSIIISEVIPNSIKINKKERVKTSGIVFCGKKIEFDKID